MHRAGPLESQRADGTRFYAFAAVAAFCLGHGLVLEGGNPTFETTPSEPDSPDLQFLAAYPYALPAEDAFIGIVDEERTALIDGQISFKLPEPLRLQFYSEVPGNFLEITQAILGTAAALQKVVR